MRSYTCECMFVCNLVSLLGKHGKRKWRGIKGIRSNGNSPLNNVYQTQFSIVNKNTSIRDKDENDDNDDYDHDNCMRLC